MGNDSSKNAIPCIRKSRADAIDALKRIQKIEYEANLEEVRLKNPTPSAPPMPEHSIPSPAPPRRTQYAYNQESLQRVQQSSSSNTNNLYPNIPSSSYQPATSNVPAQPPRSNINAQPATSNIPAQPPRSNINAQPATNNVPAQPPKSNINAQPATNNVPAQPPRSSNYAQPATSNVTSQLPSSNVTYHPLYVGDHFSPPSTSYVPSAPPRSNTPQPATTRNVAYHASTSNVNYGPGTSNAFAQPTINNVASASLPPRSYTPQPSTSNVAYRTATSNNPFQSAKRDVAGSSTSGSPLNLTKEEFMFVNSNIYGQAVVSNQAKTISPQTSSDSRSRPTNRRDRSTSRHSTTKRDSDNDDANCPSCGHRYSLKIYQCSSGHSSCERCKFSGRPCVKCRGPITDMRNIALEDLVGQLKVPCKNKSEGCSLYLRMMDMEIHDKECPFRELQCPLYAAFGNCTWQGKLSQLRTHFSTCHPQHSQAEVEIEMFLFNLHSQCKTLYLVTMGPFNFLLHIVQDGSAIKFAVQLIGTKASAQKWSYEFHVYNKAEAKRKYQYTDICKSHNVDVEDILTNCQCATLPLSYVDTFENRGQLNYKFFIKKDAEDNERKRNRRYGRGPNKGKMFAKPNERDE